MACGYCRHRRRRGGPPWPQHQQRWRSAPPVTLGSRRRRLWRLPGRRGRRACPPRAAHPWMASRGGVAGGRRGRLGSHHRRWP
eukprot:2540298-Prymnesium_polylepis.2